MNGKIKNITHAGVWLDDFQIADLRLIRGPVVKGGHINIMVEKITCPA